jgi:hypothetical protein
MTYRLRRKFTSTTFDVDGYIGKLFFEPFYEFETGYCLWNVGLAVGKSKRQLNDWYRNRHNKRRRSLRNQLTGPGTFKIWTTALKHLLRMRWECLEPGDGMVLDCTSRDPDRQFKVYTHWLRHHQDFVVNFDRREFYWFRPPYHFDPLWEIFEIRGLVPDDPTLAAVGEHYYECFRVRSLDSGIDLSSQQIVDLLDQVPSTSPSQ